MDGTSKCIINQIGVDTQNEVKKKKDCGDNSPYGQMIPEVKKNNSQTSLSLDDYWFNGSFRRRKIESSRTSIRNFMYRIVLVRDFNAAQTNGSKILWC
jgi:hypothetical protein